MSLDSLLRATGKNLFDCGEVSDYNFPIQQFSLTISDNTMSGVVLGTGNSGIVNTKHYISSGTYTFSSVISGTDSPNYRYMVRPYNSNHQIITDLTINNWTYNQWYKAYIPNSSAQVRTFTIPNTVSYWQYGLAFLGTTGETVTYSNIQLEKGSTATTYEPYEYLGPKTIKMGKNLFDISNVTGFQTMVGLTYQSYYGSVSVDKVITCRYGAYGQGLVLKDWSRYLTIGTYTISADCYYPTTTNTTKYQIVSCLHLKDGTDKLSNIYRTITPDTWTRLSFTVNIASEGDYYLLLQPVGNAGAFYPINVQFKNVQVEEGSTATDYEPYKEVLKVSYNTRNLLPYPYFHSSMTNQAGIAYTVNSDGTITASGTATGRSEFVLSANKTNWMNGNYTLSGCPAGGSKDTYSMITVNGFSDVGSGITIPQSELTRISIIIKQGTTVDNLVFKPQLELGNKKTDYVPYFNTVIWTYKQPVLTGYNITSTNNDDGTQTLNIVDATSTTDQYNITSTDNSDGTQTLSITDV